MQKSNLSLGVEWKLLELVCLGLETSHEYELFEKLLTSTDDIRWGEMLEQALRHKIICALAFHLTSKEFRHIVPLSVRRFLETTLDLNKYKIKILRREAVRIIKSLNAQKIRFVGTKGITFESTIYRQNGTRNLLDLDFMCAHEDRNIVNNTIMDLGYEIGHFDWTTNSVIPINREQKIVYSINPDHLPRFTLLTNDPIIKHIEVDFACSLTWTRSPFNVSINDALSDICYQRIPDFSEIKMPCFTPKFQFIFTILHLFREAWVFREGWTERMLGWDDDVHLSKFADVIKLWRAYENDINSQDFLDTIETYEIKDPIVWVLEHLDRTFNTNIVSSLYLTDSICEDWLSSAGASENRRPKWKGTMRERLHCKNRRQLFANSFS